jgi:putative ATP-dependent endonuclease of OLD family
VRLVSFTVQNFRSITKAHKIDVDKLTVLVGPNNEGKSNVLRALATAMKVLTAGGSLLLHRPAPARFYVPPQTFDWDRDFPIHLQGSRPDGVSLLGLEFELSPAEIADFKETIKSNLNGTLPLQLELGPARAVKVTVHKKGPGAAKLSQKSVAIARFVAERIEFQYIPAIRTAQSAQRVVDSLVEHELRTVEELPEYKQAVSKIEQLQKPVLDALSNSVKPTMVSFLPAIKGVRFSINHERRVHALRTSAQMIVNDGTPTELEYKGDGVQSLAAIALMRHSSESDRTAKNFIVAIEEPESHLHPSTMHVLKGVLQELSQKHQVVITTHSPLFVDRSTVSSNVLVHNKKARPAKSIEEIRSMLGVRAADNLKHAEIVLLVEGEDDRIALTALLKVHSPQLAASLQNAKVAVDSLNGGSNLPYKAGLVRDALCSCHCFIDNDNAGRNGFDKAKQLGLLTVGDVNFSSCPAMQESELEDLYDPTVYKDMVLNVYKVSLDNSKFKTNAKMWSDRLAAVFKAAGKPWDDSIKAEVKLRVARLVEANPLAALHPAKRAAFDGLVDGLIARLNDPPSE